MELEWNSEPFRRQVREATMRGVTSWISKVENESLRMILNTPKTGRIYRRRGVEHQASAPGEAPASDTGNLVKSGRIDLFEERLAARLNYSTAYALALELGYPDNNLDPRPWLVKSLENTNDEGLQAVRDELRAEFGSGAL